MDSLSVLAYLSVIVISGAVGLYAWRRSVLPGARSFASIALCEAAWTSAYLLQRAALDRDGQIFWNNVQFTAVLGTALFYLRFALVYTGRKPAEVAVTWRRLTVAAGLLAAWIWADSFHHLFRLLPHLDAQGGLVFESGPTFPLFTIFTYGLVCFSSYLLAANFWVSPRIYRLQVGTVLVGILIPWLTSVLAALDWLPQAMHDLTPLMFAPSNLVMLWALFRFHLFDITPIARDVLVERMRDGLIVLDRRKRIVDFNPAARRFLGLSNMDSPGKYIGRELPALHQLVIHLIESPNSSAEISLEVAGKPARFELTATPIHDVLGILSGHLVLMRDITEQKRVEEKLHRLALTDPLTGVLNRRAFFQLALPEFERARRYHHWLSFILIDIDHFKNFNDSYGHLVGDQVLENLARACQHALRDADKLARYGGEEFVIMLPETDTAGVRLAAERLRQIIAAIKMDTIQGPIQITASLGAATFSPFSSSQSLDRLLSQADQALYFAKQTGRNRICLWEELHTADLKTKSSIEV